MGVVFADSEGRDAFSRVRVSNPDTLMEAKFHYDKGPSTWDELTANGGTAVLDQDESTISMTVTATDESRVVRQHHGYHPYEPGKSQFITETFVLGTPDAGVIKCVGYYDDNDGILLQLDEDGPVFIRRSSVTGSVVDTEVRQADWSIDRLDGTGRSGIALDLSKAQLLTVDLQWLSAGRVRIGFDIGGSIIYAHEFLAANVLDVPYMRTAVLPVRYEIHRQTAGAVSSSMKQICSSVMAEGGHTRSRGLFFSADNGTTSVAAPENTLRPILSIRPALLFKGIANRVPVFPLAIEVLCETKPVHWEIVLNPTLTGASWGPAETDSCMEMDVASTAMADGDHILGGYCAAAGPGANANGGGDQNLFGDLQLALDIAGTDQSNILTIAAAGIGGAAVAYGQVTWRELQ
ncbi:MAG: hypothetical protein V3R71_06035 [Gemmatimonadales bacterium]